MMKDIRKGEKKIWPGNGKRKLVYRRRPENKVKIHKDILYSNIFTIIQEPFIIWDCTCDQVN